MKKATATPVLFVIASFAITSLCFADIAEEKAVTTTAASAPEMTVASTPAAPDAALTPSVPAEAATIANPYTNVSDSEFALLQSLAAQLDAAAKDGVAKASSTLHSGQYGVDHYAQMRQSFADAAGTLTSTLHNAPIDIRKVHMTIKALKTLVLDIDDVFVYNPSFLNQLRGWNECKRILRRVDGIVYREGGLRRAERIWDANPFLRDVGRFLNVHGVLSGADDKMHRADCTAPMDKFVGHHGGGRKATHVWIVPGNSYQGDLANNSDAFNGSVTQY